MTALGSQPEPAGLALGRAHRPVTAAAQTSESCPVLRVSGWRSLVNTESADAASNLRLCASVCSVVLLSYESEDDSRAEPEVCQHQRQAANQV